MDFILSSIAFILVFTVLIYVHELGHFWACRWAKIRVEEFGFGLPPRIWGKKIGKTLWSINWIPVGGFVKPYGEDSTDEKILKAKDSFQSASKLERLVVLAGGVSMNFLFAFLLLTFVFTIGMHPLAIVPDDSGFSGRSLVFLTESKALERGLIDEGDVGVKIEKVLETSEFKDVFRAGDRITKIDNQNIILLSQFLHRKSSGNREMNVEIERDGKTIREEITLGEDRSIGIAISGGTINKENAFFKFPFYAAPFYAARETVVLVGENFRMFGKLLTNFKETSKNVSGPVGIARATDDVVKTGEFFNILLFTVILSISLGAVNILPLPALDGGRIVFIFYEIIARKRANARVENIVNATGMVLLLLLLAIVTFNDLVR